MAEPLTSCLGCDQLIPKGMRDSRCLDCQRGRDREKNQRSAHYRTRSWRDIRRDCVARDGHHCIVCTGTYRLTAHHMIALADGGPDQLWNLTTLCQSCHAHVERQLRHGIPIECCPVLALVAEVQAQQARDAGISLPGPVLTYLHI